ncbi:LOW QUALITY PROTEIN: transmembrane protein 158 [Thomomys bottae]
MAEFSSGTTTTTTHLVPDRRLLPCSHDRRRRGPRQPGAREAAAPGPRHGGRARRRGAVGVVGPPDGRRGRRGAAGRPRGGGRRAPARAPCNISVQRPLLGSLLVRWGGGGGGGRGPPCDLLVFSTSAHGRAVLAAAFHRVGPPLLVEHPGLAAGGAPQDLRLCVGCGWGTPGRGEAGSRPGDVHPAAGTRATAIRTPADPGPAAADHAPKTADSASTTAAGHAPTTIADHAPTAAADSASTADHAPKASADPASTAAADPASTAAADHAPKAAADSASTAAADHAPKAAADHASTDHAPTAAAGHAPTAAAGHAPAAWLQAQPWRFCCLDFSLDDLPGDPAWRLNRKPIESTLVACFMTLVIVVWSVAALIWPVPIIAGFLPNGMEPRRTTATTTTATATTATTATTTAPAATSGPATD